MMSIILFVTINLIVASVLMLVMRLTIKSVMPDLGIGLTWVQAAFATPVAGRLAWQATHSVFWTVMSVLGTLVLGILYAMVVTELTNYDGWETIPVGLCALLAVLAIGMAVPALGYAMWKTTQSVYWTVVSVMMASVPLSWAGWLLRRHESELTALMEKSEQ